MKREQTSEWLTTRKSKTLKERARKWEDDTNPLFLCVGFWLFVFAYQIFREFIHIQHYSRIKCVNRVCAVLCYMNRFECDIVYIWIGERMRERESEPCNAFAVCHCMECMFCHVCTQSFWSTNFYLLPTVFFLLPLLLLSFGHSIQLKINLMEYFDYFC